MELKQFLQSAFNKQNFIKFISERFYGFAPNLQENEYLGKVKLDDRSEIGFFVFEVNEHKDIENSRVGFHKELKTYADEHMLDGAIGAFYHPLQHVWRLSFVRFNYDDKHKKETTSQKRFTFLLGNEKIKTANEQLKNLKYPKIVELEKAFSVESVTKEFYKGLVKEYEKLLNEYLTYPTNSDNDKKEFAIRLIGRILFIKFLNKKVLIPDDIFLTCQDYYHEKLEPLFFEQLNTQKVERKKEFVNDSIPFLNGGLFEPLNLDFYEWNGDESRYSHILKVDDRFFSELYEHLNQFNFTIDENSIEDSDLSIDPEMLGRIFENLLAEINPETSQNARKSTGSYYTPREIVEYMVNSSLLEYIKTKTEMDEEVLKTIIFKNQEPSHDYDKTKILSAIFELKILDPACGSGAFPMGLLQRIVKILELIDEDATIWFNLQNREFKDAHKNRNKNYIRKLSIIKNTIYGIDIQPIAIEISKLRFFLSLIVDEEGEPEPLPNLEFKFVCANSLLPLKKDTQLDGLFENNTSYSTSTDGAKKYFDLENELINIKNRYFEANGVNKNIEKDKYYNIQKLMLAELINNSTINADENLLCYDPFDPLSVAGFFDSDFMFNIKDGFDIVIGNPPYIKEYTNKKAFDKIRENKKYYQGKMDIWYFFACVGIDLLKTNGVLLFIAPNNWITNSGASKLRNKVLEDTRIIEFIDFGDFKVFESADIQTMVMNLQVTKDNNEYNCIYSKLLDKEYSKNRIEDFLDKKQNQKFLISKTHIIKSDLKDKNISFSEDKHFIILNKIENSKNFELTVLEVANGIHTHHSEVTKKMLEIDDTLILKEGIFVINNEEKESLNLSLKELELIKPLYISEQINGYRVNSENKFWIIYTDSSFKNIETIKPYPNIKKHLDKFSKVITSDNKPYGLHRARNQNFFVGEKIASLIKCPNRPSFSYLNFDSYLQAEYYLIKSNRINLKYLTAIFNSKLISYWLKHKGKMQGNNYQIDKEPILNIPIKKIEVTKPFEILVDYIIFLKQQEFNQNDDLKFAKDRLMVSFFERLIDCMVYELYFADELHKENKYFIEPLQKENLIDVQNMENKLDSIRAIFEKLNDKNHTIKKNMYFIDSVEVVRIIEGKDNENN